MSTILTTVCQILYAIFVIYDLTLAINAIYPILDTSSFESICPNGTPYHARPPMNVFEWISYIAIISGGLWRLWAMRTLGRLFTFEISIRASHEVITTGPYAWVRHPSYTSGLIAGSGGIMMLFMAQVWPCSGVQYSETKMMAFIVMFFSLGTYGSLGRIKKEEEALRKEFGPKWVEYTKKTPYLMIPGIY
jgi:protein-S-isoprenylcysteine O-methyltransferase Ste14